MPYQRTLQKYTLPEFYAQAPDSWEQRLREVSPMLPNTSHLRFRKFEPAVPFNPTIPAWAQDTRGDWDYPERPIWALYICTPRHLVAPEKADLLQKHWSECFDQGEQVGHKSVVSNYQHFMWHTEGLSVKPFLLLQGESGGTVAKYTDRERAYLKGVGAALDPLPIGALPACPFDSRSIAVIQKRDRLIQAGNRFDALEKMDRPAAKKAEDDAAELLYRETVLDTLSELNAPNVEYMKSQKAKAEFADAEQSGFLPPAPKGLDRVLATFKDVFKETGRMPMVSTASMRKLHPVH
jgi:hypothetical protein